MDELNGVGESYEVSLSLAAGRRASECERPRTRGDPGTKRARQQHPGKLSSSARGKEKLEKIELAQPNA